ncbi:MAG: response regulator [Deltaproteobacteria bacterium]|nr:MAG: response regulator [Deltaproteobacteria bacterium]
MRAGGDRDAALYAEYRAGIEGEAMGRSLGTAIFVLFVVNAVFVGVDALVYPESFARFLPLRIGLSAALIAIYFRTRFAYPLASTVVTCLAGGAMLLAVVQGTGGFDSEYYVGLILLFLGIGALVPLSARQAALIIGVVLAGYAALPVFDDEPGPWTHVALHGFFMLGAAFAGTMSCALLDRLRFADFVQRHELEAARDELKQLDRAKSRFTANVHHELRTPLTLVLASVESILDRESDLDAATARSYLESARVNGLRLLKLINNLLDLAKLESQRLEIRRVPLDVGRVARDLAVGARPLAESKGVSLATEGLEGLPSVHADPEALEKVILNLIGNALKFTDAGGRIELRGAAAEGGIELAVCDTGVGIPAGELERIFDRFAQVDGSATRKHEGTGIGLALAKELVELHGGRIGVESAGPGRGSTFRVWIPTGESDEVEPEVMLQGGDGRALSLARSLAGIEAELDLGQRHDEAYQLSDLSRNLERAGASEPIAPRPEAAPDTVAPDAAEVLVVEDNGAMRRLLSNILSREFRVRTATNGREGLDAVRASKPSVVLSDIMMPEMSGTEMCRALKEDPETRDIPVVLVTSKGEREMKLEGLELGAQDYVTKPFHPRELLARVRSFARLRSLQEQLDRRNEMLETALRELRETEVQLVQSERLAAVGELAAGIAHEVNNPVNFAVNSLDALRSRVEDVCSMLGQISKLDPNDAVGWEAGVREVEQVRASLGFESLVGELHELVGIVSEGLGRTHRLVGDLRDFAGPGGGEDASADVREGLMATLRLMQHALREAEIRVETEIAPDLPAVRGSPAGVNQVFLNLLKNSADALQAPGGTVRVSARRDGGDVVIEVVDDGPGIDPEVAETLFEPFVTTKEAGKGTGLGLSVCRRIVSAMGGSLELKPSEVGAHFEVRLPEERRRAT